MNGIYLERPAMIIMAIAAVVTVVLLVGGLLAVGNQPITGDEINRIVEEVEQAADGDNTVMVNVQAAAGFGIIQHAQSAQTKSDTRTTTTTTPEVKTAGLPGWQLILIVAACFLPVCALGCWLLFDR